MQISGISNSIYQTTKASNLSQPTQPNSTTNTSSRESSVTLSPEAKAELEKMAMYTRQTADYLPKVTVLNNPHSQAIGYAAWAEDFQSRYSNELNEYGKKFKDYYEEAKVDHGILTADDHYEKVLKLKGKNTEFQQAFEDKLNSDPRMLELMDILGIDKPA